MANFCDPFIDALADPKLMQTLRSNRDVAAHIAEDPEDADFCNTLEKLHTAAKRLFKEKNPSDVDRQAVGIKAAHEAYADPYVMQAIMTLYGKPPKVGEDLDARQHEPLGAKHLEALGDLDDAENAKAKGNDYIKAGDHAMALAHYQRAITIVRMADNDSPLLVALLSNSALCLIKLNFPDRAKASTTHALRTLDKVDDKIFDKSKLFYRRALACEKLEEFSMAVDDLKRALKEVQRVAAGSAEENKMSNEIKRMQRLDTAQIAALKKRDDERNYWAPFVKSDAVADYEEANKWSHGDTTESRFDETGKEGKLDKWGDRFPEETSKENQEGATSGQNEGS